MSHTPGALIARRYLNAIRPANGSIGPPPLGGFTIFSGIAVPVPPLTVQGNAQIAQQEFTSYATIDNPETFESFAVTDNLDGIPLTSNGHVFTSETFGGGFVELNTGAGRFNTTPGGANYYSPIGLSDTFELALPAGIVGFGFYGTDFGDFAVAPTPPSWVIRLTDDLANTATYNLPHNLQNGSLMFWGFIDTTGRTYTNIVIEKVDPGGDIVGVDDIRLLSAAQIIT